VVRNVQLGLAPFLSASAGVPIVIDPVLAASDGTVLLERRAWGVLQSLIGSAALVTPNLQEAAALTECDTSIAVRDGGSVSLRWLEGERIPGGPFHGTGCALSSAITAQLALGAALEDAVDRGRQFVANALRNSAGSGARARLLAYSCTD